MTKKKLAVFIGIFVILSWLILYGSYFKTPPPFPANDEVIKAMNKAFPKASANVVQDTIAVGDHHMLVPFISHSNDYGMSYWTLEKNKWQIASIQTKGEPWLWEIVRNDPSTHYLVWNIDPEDQLASIHFYYLKKRNYLVIKGTEHYYYPQVQMEEYVSLEEKSYGVMQLPSDWIATINALNAIETVSQTDWFTNQFNVHQQFTFGWIPRDQMGNTVFPKASVNSDSFSTGKIHLGFVRMLNEEELEQTE